MSGDPKNFLPRALCASQANPVCSAGSVVPGEYIVSWGNDMYWWAEEIPASATSPFFFCSCHAMPRMSTGSCEPQAASRKLQAAASKGVAAKGGSLELHKEMQCNGMSSRRQCNAPTSIKITPRRACWQRPMQFTTRQTGQRRQTSDCEACIWVTVSTSVRVLHDDMRLCHGLPDLPDS